MSRTKKPTPAKKPAATKSPARAAAAPASGRGSAARKASAKPAAKPARKSGRAAATSGDSDSASGIPDLGLAIRLAARWPTLTDAQRRAFQRQFSDALCDRLGGETKAELVIREALSWAAILDRELRLPHASEIRYAPVRFAWFLECIRALGAALGEQIAVRGSSSATRQLLGRSLEDAKTLEEELRRSVRDLAGDDDTLRDEVSQLGLASDDVEGAVKGLRALATLIEGWAQGEDEDLHVLLAASNLGEGDVRRAREAADALERAHESTRGGRVNVRDTPAVNRLEGRVLAEMRVAKRAFDAARRRNKLVASLVPGRGTRAVLAKASRVENDEEPMPTPAK